MRSTTSCLAAISVLVQLVPSASAHGYVNLIKTGGKFYPGWDLLDYYNSKPPAVAGWSTTALDSGFVRPQPQIPPPPPLRQPQANNPPRFPPTATKPPT
jgi:hypothetical protein